MPTMMSVGEGPNDPDAAVLREGIDGGSHGEENVCIPGAEGMAQRSEDR